MSYKTVIFDLDGTLLNTLGDLHAAVNYALEANRFPGRTIDEVCSFVGNGIRKLIERAVPSGTPAELIDKCFSEFRSYYYEHMMVLTKPYPGIIDCLEELHSHNIKIAIASNKFDQGVKKLSEHYFGSLVDVALGESPEHGKKPDPLMVDCCLQELGLTRENAVYIGDSEPDVLTARNAQLPCIIVNWGFRSEETMIQYGATAIAHSTSELLHMLLSEK